MCIASKLQSEIQTKQYNMKTNYIIIGKLPTKRSLKSIGFIIGKEGDSETILQEPDSSLEDTERYMRLLIKSGCTECRIEETALPTDDESIINVSLS